MVNVAHACSVLCRGFRARHYRIHSELIFRTLTPFTRRCCNGDVETVERKQRYKDLPAVDELLGRPLVEKWLQANPRELVVAEIRETLEEARTGIRNGLWDDGPPGEWSGDISERVEERVAQRIEARGQPSLRKVINAGGVILHTNLGRAPLSARAVEAIRRTAGGYSNLEYELSQGQRGRRDVHAGELLEKLLGAPAIVVNNNAAAIFLVLNELAQDGEVVVSRGELIEIGDGFRIPDIMSRSGVRLHEVGATNRTHIADYRAAVNADTRLLLRVHHSNFRMVGFTSRPSLEELVSLGKELGLPVVEDLGSGCLYDLAGAGFDDEPPVTGSLQAGVDLVTFSGDKLLGGPQAGIIAGRAEWVRRVRRNPLFRALRVDKLTYAALEATLNGYLFQRYDEIPVLRMVRESVESIRRRAEHFVKSIRGDAELVAGQSVLGGGAAPAETLPTTLIAVSPPNGLSAAKLEQRLRQGDPPVIARCERNRVVVDLRTVSREDEEALARGLREALAGA